MHNCIFLLGLPIETQVIDEQTVRDVIDSKRKQWLDDLSHPVKCVFAQKCLEALPYIKDVMFDLKRREIEIAEAREIKTSMHEELSQDILFLRQNQSELTEKHIKMFAKKYQFYGIGKEEILDKIKLLYAEKDNK